MRKKNAAKGQAMVEIRTIYSSVASATGDMQRLAGRSTDVLFMNRWRKRSLNRYAGHNVMTKKGSSGNGQPRLRRGLQLRHKKKHKANYPTRWDAGRTKAGRCKLHTCVTPVTHGMNGRMSFDTKNSNQPGTRPPLRLRRTILR